MKNKDSNNIIPVQALELLPWYALGLLEGQEKKFMEKALLNFPQLQEHLKLEHEMAQHLRKEKDLLSLSAIEERSERLKSLLERKDFQSESSEQQKAIVGVNTKIADFFKSLLSGQMSKTQYMGFAAISTLSIALLFAFTMPLFEHESTFYPAAANVEKENLDKGLDKNTLLIGLSVAPDDPRLSKIFSKYDVEAQAISGKDGMYRLSFTKNEKNLDNVKELLSTLSKETELVWFVGEAY